MISINDTELMADVHYCLNLFRSFPEELDKESLVWEAVQVALEKFDASKNVKFRTFLAYIFRNTLIEELRRLNSDHGYRKYEISCSTETIQDGMYFEVQPVEYDEMFEEICKIVVNKKYLPVIFNIETADEAARRLNMNVQSVRTIVSRELKKIKEEYHVVIRKAYARKRRKSQDAPDIKLKTDECTTSNSIVSAIGEDSERSDIDSHGGA